MTRSRSAAPTQEANGTWRFVVDLGSGLNAAGEWRERRQALRRGFPTKAAAKAAMAELVVKSKQGTAVAPQRQTVRAFLEDDWLPTVARKLAPTTIESYARNIRLHVVPHIGGMQLQALDGAALNRLYTHLETAGRKRGQQGAGLKPRTVRYIHTIIHAALDDAVKGRRVEVNAADQATPPSAKAAKAPEMHTWTGAELRTFLVGHAGADRRGRAIAFLAGTACRRGEALGIRWEDIDLDGGEAKIRQQVILLTKATGRGREAVIAPGTKGGDARPIELDQQTVAMLRAWKAQQAQERLLLGAGYQDHGLVFPDVDGRPMHPEVFSKTFDRRVAASGLPVIRPHDLRHTWATLALEAGVDVAVVSKQLGHSSPLVTWNTYQHVRKTTKTDAANRVAAVIWGAGS